MAWKTLYLKSAANLTIKNSQIVVKSETENALPLEDVLSIVIENPAVEMTSGFLGRCADYGINVIVPGAAFKPSGIMQSVAFNARTAGVQFEQISMSEPFKKRLWQAIVRRKIFNQHRHLLMRGVETNLGEMASRVQSGDPKNVEALAARAYWQKLFENFTRDDETDIRNSCLNYAYAVLRSAVTRSVLAVGLNPAFGVHHSSKNNPFNLVDDLIEPFRPIIDQHVCALEIPEYEKLNPDIKAALVAVMIKDVRYASNTTTLSTAVSLSVEAFCRAVLSRDFEKLEFVEFQNHEKRGH